MSSLQLFTLSLVIFVETVKLIKDYKFEETFFLYNAQPQLEEGKQ